MHHNPTLLPGPGDRARVVQEDRAARRPVPAGVVLGGRDPVPRAAGGEAGRGGGVAREGDGDSDALCAVRRWLWDEAVLPRAGDAAALQKLPAPVRELPLTTLAPAA